MLRVFLFKDSVADEVRVSMLILAAHACELQEGLN